MTKISVTVTGPQGTGKTTIREAVNALLTSVGMTVTTDHKAPQRVAYPADLLDIELPSPEALAKLRDFTNPPATAEIMVPAKITDEMIANAAVGWFETSYCEEMIGWAYAFPARHPTEPEPSYENPRYSDAKYWADGHGVTLTMENPNGGEHQKHTVRKPEIIAGLRKMAAGSPNHFADFLTENGDAITDNVVLQYIVYGEIIYG